MKNDAFISYSRKDKLFAAVLEKSLENYRPPKGIGTQGRNLNIFRDEQDFTGVDYHQALGEHLRDSNKLIVLCSPHARKSTYVNEEIERYVQQSGASNVIPLLVAGIANNEAEPDHEDQMAFPEALCQKMTMPLAIDYRNFDASIEKINKGVYYGQWYTLLANLYNVSRRDIEQRDKKRRVRRMALAIATTSCVIITLTFLLIFALTSRQQAIKQRRLADNQRQVAMDTLFNLTYKLPQQLSKLPNSLVTRLKVAELNTIALQRLYGLTPDKLRIERELATNNRLWAGFLLEAKDYPQAYKKFKKSAQYSQHLISAEPNSAPWQRDLAVSYYNAGIVQERMGNIKLACSEYQNALEPARAAVHMEPKQVKWKKLLQDVEEKRSSECHYQIEPKSN